LYPPYEFEMVKFSVNRTFNVCLEIKRLNCALNVSGSIVSVNITDYGAYYSTTPTAAANGSNTTQATFSVTLKHYANSTSGSANVTYYT